MTWMAQKTGKAVVPVVQAFDVNDRDFTAALINGSVSPSAGVIAFPFEQIAQSEGKKTILKQVYST